MGVQILLRIAYHSVIRSFHTVKTAGTSGISPGTHCQGYISDAALFNSNCYSHTPTENIAIYFYMGHRLHSKLTEIVECWHGLSSEQRRERCFNGAASPQSKCVEGMLPFLTNAVRWCSRTGARGTSLFARRVSSKLLF
ncbi:unnamed protein product [Ixodes pacificus]